MATWQRLIRFIPKQSQEILIGQPVDATVDVGKTDKPVQVEVFSGSSILDENIKSTGKIVELGKLLSPLAMESVGTIRCIGLNYALHVKEAGMPTPTEPTLFLKPATSLNNPGDAVKIPDAFLKNNCADYESELAVIIGRAAKDVKEEDAMNFCLGFTGANDISSRVPQFSQSQWCFSKGFDSACPLGPAVVSAKAVKDPSIFTIKGYLNDEQVQSSSLSDLVFSVPKIIAFLSQGTTLLPGTVILTGTPSGVGWPNRFMKPGDKFTVYLSDGVGSLVSPIE